MSSIGIPRQIKKILTCQCEKQYTKALKARKKTYREWLTEVEESHSDYVSSEKSSGEQVICLPLKEGCMTLAAVPICSAYMEAHPQALILYGDEDIMENGIRHTPRFLPDWSPDTFLGQTDIYGMIVVRRKWLQSLPAFWDLSEQTWISFGEEKRKNIVKQLITLAGGFAPNCHTIGHVPRVLFHKTDSGNRKEKVE